MIRIDEKLAAEAASIHLEACKPYVENRLRFLVDLFDVLSNQTFQNYSEQQEIIDKYHISFKSIKAVLSPILLKKDELSIEDIQRCFSSGDNTMFNKEEDYFEQALDFFSFIKNDLDNILIGAPNYLFENYVENRQEQTEFTSLLVKIFNYEKLTDAGFNYRNDLNWNSYALTKKLKVNVCPYCNKNWVNTVVDEKGNKVTNPQLDHFFPKNKYPILRLSFYNLIPSCETCNSRIKGEDYLSMDAYIHPHHEGFDPEYYFAPMPKNTNSALGFDDEYTITLKEDDSSDKYTKAKGSFDFFHIKDIYEQHGDIISEIYYKRAKYNLTALEDLLKHDMFKGMSLDEAYRFVFANYLKEEDYSKRPFAKLTKDTLRYLELDTLTTSGND